MPQTQTGSVNVLCLPLVAAVCASWGLAFAEETRRGDGPLGERPLPTYVARRVLDPIIIDGKAQEKTWQEAKRAAPWYAWDGKEHADVTDCKLAWDDKALYLLFVCRDDDIQASLRQRDDPLYSEDVVEVFIDADGDEKTYMELIVNPLNTVFDSYVLRDPRENRNAGIPSWTCAGLTTAVTVDGTVRNPKKSKPNDKDKQWVVEVRIPFESFVLTAGPSGKPPRDGDVWRMALTRYDRPDPKTFVHLAWSPPYSCGWPHVTRRFGRVVFSTKPAGQ